MTQPAVGIHAHPNKKLGKQPPSNKPALLFGQHLAAAVPTAPIADVAPNLQYPMDLNDQWGDCVVAGADHALQVIYTALKGSYTNWSDAQILSYYQTQNPTFDPNSQNNGPGSNADAGMDIQTFLEHLQQQGIIVAFAKIDPHNEAEVKAAIYLGLAIITGETLEVAQQNQTVWDSSPSPQWGGHCTTWVGYKGKPDYDSCVTWGSLTDMTQAFVDNQVEEAWFILTKAHLDNPAFRAGFNLQSFADAYTAITGKAFPVPVPPAPAPPPPTPTPTPVPTPTPTPTPTPVPPSPGDDPFQKALVAYPGLDKWLQKAADRSKINGKQLTLWTYSAWLLSRVAGIRMGDSEDAGGN